MIRVQRKGQSSTTSSTARPFQTLLVIPIGEVSSPLLPAQDRWKQSKGEHLDTYQSSDGKQELLQRLSNHQMSDVQGAGDNHLMQDGQLGNQMTNDIPQKSHKATLVANYTLNAESSFYVQSCGLFLESTSQPKSTPSPFSGENTAVHVCSQEPIY